MAILRASGRRSMETLQQGDQPALMELGYEAPAPWPKTRFVGSAISQGGGLDLAPLHRVIYTTQNLYTGGSGHKRLSGVTKDSTGAPLPGCTVWAMRSTDDIPRSRYAYQQEGTIGVSDAAGNYEVMVPTGDQYRIISEGMNGATPVAGITVKTLVGT